MTDYENELATTEEVGAEVWNRRSIRGDSRSDGEQKTECEFSDLNDSKSRIALIEKREMGCRSIPSVLSSSD